VQNVQFAALLLYVSIAALLFAQPTATHFATSYVGRGVDQPFFIWCLVWWPYALAHHLNPFFTKFVFVPAGLNLTWTTPIPLLSILAWPLTKTIGPIAAYNMLCVICPALSAFSAFLLCHYLTRAFWPSLLGGYIFGFSPYVLGHVLGGHPDCFSIFLIPPMVRVVLARLDGQISRRSFGLLSFMLLAAQFLIADEMIATVTVAGAAGLMSAWIFGDNHIRRGIEGLAAPIALAYLGTTTLMSPWLYYVFHDFLHKPLRAPQEYSIDLLNLIIPTRTIGWSYIYSFVGDPASRFTGNISEESGYVGVPLLGVALWFVLTRRRTFAGKVLGAMLALTAVMSMGPRLHIAGIATVTMPWRVAEHLPLLNQALPGRIFLYTTLALAIVTAMWFSSTHIRLWARASIAATLILSLAPKPSVFWSEHANHHMIPRFFSSGLYQQYLAKGEIIAVPPSDWGAGSEAMVWQAETGMYFRLATGYLPFAPASTFEWPIVTALMQQVILPDAADQWTAFAASRRCSLAMVRDHQPHSLALDQMFEVIGASRIKVGGIILYRMPPGRFEDYRSADATRMEALEQEQRFRRLLVAAQAYLKGGAEPAKLTLNAALKNNAQALEWKPWGMQPDESSVTLRSEGARHVLVGVTGTYEALVPLIRRYRQLAESLYFPFPHRLGEIAPPGKHCPRPLVMIFDRQGLCRAAAVANSSEQPDAQRICTSHEPPAGRGLADLVTSPTGNNIFYREAVDGTNPTKQDHRDSRDHASASPSHR
jgi:hypothetical protein